jgi:serine/threonine protein kinase/tetratricopeptide (TPR) repeat protein
MQHRIIDRRYEILKKQGAGATGKVYKVKDLRDQRIVALKILSKKVTSSQEIKRFKREFRLLSQLHHPNLCSVYDFGVLKDGRSYFTLEYVNGKNIFQAAGNASRVTVCTWIVELCRVLEYIHAKGFIHYDVKPSNVLIAESAKSEELSAQNTATHVKLMDFGLAGESRLSFGRRGEQRLKGGAFIKGTFPYIAPEVVKGLAVDHRADLYSLGVLLYEVLTRKYFQTADKESFASILEQQDYYSKSVSKIISDIPYGFGRLLVRLLTFEPAMRFSRANEIIKEINRFSGLKFTLETEKTLEGYLLSSRFVGREREMKSLISSYERARGGNGNIIMISGEAGIGKSRLLREFKIFTQLQRSHTFFGYAHKDKIGALEPFFYIFSELINYIKPTSRLKTSLAILFKLFPDLVDENLKRKLPKLATLDPQQEKLRYFEALSGLIGSISTDLGELIILLEDLHWADDLSFQFLEYLGRNIVDKNILICATYREEELKERPLFKNMIDNLRNYGCLHHVVLGSFSLRRLHEFLDSTITSHSNSYALARYLMEKTNGNPFFVEEILRTFLKAKGVRIGVKLNIDDIKRIPVPETIEDTILKRIEDLDHTLREIVKVAAVFMKGFTYEIMMQLMGLNDTELSKALWELKRKQVFVEDGRIYRFYHATLREVQQKRMKSREWQELNRRVGEALETVNRKRLDSVVEDVAYYFINAKNRKNGIRYGLCAAEKSSGRYANEQAIQYYSGVLGLLNDNELERRFTIYQKRAYIEARAGYYNDAIENYNQALKIHRGTVDEKVRIYGHMAYIYESMGNYSHAVWTYQKGLELLKKMKDPRMKKLRTIEFIAKMNRTYLMLGDYKHVRRFNVKTQQFLRAITGKNIVQLKGSIYGSMGDVEFYGSEYGKGDCDRAIYYYKEAYKYYKMAHNEAGIAAVLNNLGNSSQLKFYYQQASDYYRRSIRWSKKIGEQHGVAIKLLNLGGILKERGNYSDALDCFQRALVVSKKIGNQRIIGGALSEIGSCLLTLCRYQEAEIYTKQACKILNTIGWSEKHIYSLMILAHINQTKGDYSLSLKYYRRALKSMQNCGQQRSAGRLFILMSMAFIELGAIPDARHCIDEARKVASTFSSHDVEIECYTALCFICVISNEYKKATDYCIRGIALAKKFHMKRRSVRLFILLSEIYAHQEKHHKGFEIADEMVECAREMGTKDIYIMALLMRGDNGFRSHMLSKRDCVTMYDEALGCAEGIDYPEILWRVYYTYGMMHYRCKSYRKALYYYKKCITVWSDVTGKIHQKKLRKSYLHRPDRQAVFTAIDEIEKSTLLS